MLKARQLLESMPDTIYTVVDAALKNFPDAEWNNDGDAAFIDAINDEDFISITIADRGEVVINYESFDGGVISSKRLLNINELTGNVEDDADILTYAIKSSAIYANNIGT